MNRLPVCPGQDATLRGPGLSADCQKADPNLDTKRVMTDYRI